MGRTLGQIESDISDAIVRFEKDFMGRGPEETKTYVIGDMIIVRLKGVLTPAETQLAKTTESSEGRMLIKRVRIELLENARPLLHEIIHDITGCGVQSLHTDISTVTGERVIIFTMDSDVTGQGKPSAK